MQGAWLLFFACASGSELVQLLMALAILTVLVLDIADYVRTLFKLLGFTRLRSSIVLKKARSRLVFPWLNRVGRNSARSIAPAAPSCGVWRPPPQATPRYQAVAQRCSIAHRAWATKAASSVGC